MHIAIANSPTCAGKSNAVADLRVSPTVSRGCATKRHPKNGWPQPPTGTQKCLQEGITAVGDICNGASTFPLKQKSPVHYHNFIEYFGLQATDFSQTDAVAAEAARLGLPHSATPHSTYSLQDKPFREIAHRDNPLSIHFMESPGEQELFEGRGRLQARNLESGVGIDFAGYGSPASRIVASVPPDKNILLIHNTFVDEEVIDRIESHFELGPGHLGALPALE